MCYNIFIMYPELSVNPQSESKFKKRVPLWLAVFLVIIALTAGVFWGEGIADKKNSDNLSAKTYGTVVSKDGPLPEYLTKDVNFNLFWEVWQKIQNLYIDRPVGETKMLYGAMSGLVGSLGDPYSIFLEPVTTKKFSDDLKGKFEGIGAEIGLRDKLITIVSPLPESPAERAGLKAGDKIVEINGESTEKMTLDDAVNKIRGDKGTIVKLKIFREKDNNFHEYDITRDEIKIVSVRLEIKDNNIAYLQVTNFNDDTDVRFKKAVEEIILKNPKGIILDMRNNPGGYLERAVDVASYWLTSDQSVVLEEFASGERQTYFSKGVGQLKNYPTVVLVNGGSASASEIVAGALQDAGLAKLVGEKTFGKGSVQTLENLSDGSSVKLTIARWLTPLGRQIDVVGIEPDEKIELTEEDFNQGKDPQLDKALEMLSR
ncbi:MAG TPA: S41 family peptidase [bacterium]|nr:S41 family peptidase [bacterium]